MADATADFKKSIGELCNAKSAAADNQAHIFGEIKRDATDD